MKFRIIATVVLVAALAAVALLSNTDTKSPKATPTMADDAALKSLSIN